MPDDRWLAAEPYERYMGRWSRRLAADVVHRLQRPSGRRWLDVGCGTGAATHAVLAAADPRWVLGVDPSPGFVAAARSSSGVRAGFAVGSAAALPVPDAVVDEVICGLVLTFVADPARALAEMRRVLAPGGRVAAYVWDYTDGMQMLRCFWSAAAESHPAARELDEGVRFAGLGAEWLALLAVQAGLADVEVASVVVPTEFADLDDYWTPFLGGQGPAPAYLAALPAEGRERLRDRLLQSLPFAADGSVALPARAWVMTGHRAD